jgi:hypothetical protein
LNRFFIVHCVALPPDLLEFLAELHQVHNGFRGRGLELDCAQNTFSQFRRQKSGQRFSERGNMQRTARTHA